MFIFGFLKMINVINKLGNNEISLIKWLYVNSWGRKL